jgi:hypothetical protein
MLRWPISVRQWHEISRCALGMIAFVRFFFDVIPSPSTALAINSAEGSCAC